LAWFWTSYKATDIVFRMEDDEAFEQVHALPARLYAEGLIEGVRVDHIDGLSDPAGYCQRLRRHLDPTQPARPYQHRCASITL